MFSNKFKSGILSLSLLLVLFGCSKDDASSSNQDEQAGVLSNEELTLTYGKSLLNQNVESFNTRLLFDRFGQGAQARSGSFVAEPIPELAGYTQLIDSPGLNFDINTGGKFYIQEGTTFSGNIYFNGAGTLVILGKLASNHPITVPSGGKIYIGSNAIFDSNTSVHVNQGGKMFNYGNYTYNSSSVDGDIVNYKTITFQGTSNLGFTQHATIDNYCKMIVNTRVTIAKKVNNYGYINFTSGLFIESTGKIEVKPGSFLEISGGVFTHNNSGLIENLDSSGFARLDINGVNSQDPLFFPPINGKIDVNYNPTNFKITKNAEVTENQNLAVGDGNCIPLKGNSSNTTCNDDLLNYTFVANVISPSVNGTTLSATDVRIVNGFAYVSYHTNDQVFGDAPNGSLRVFNIQNQNSPALIAQADFNNAEFNGVDVNDNTLYAVGGNKAGARMFKASLNQGTFTNNLASFSPFKLPSITAKNSFVQGNNIWLASGNANGGVFKLDANNNYSNTMVKIIDGAKYIAQNGSKQAFFATTASGAYLRIAGIDGLGAAEYNYPNLVQTIRDGKNVIAMDENYVYVALSDKGVAKFSLQDGTMKQHFEPNQYRVAGNKIFKKNGLTNGVALSDCYLYLANGADGVIVLNKDTFQVVGNFNLSDSANFIYAKDGLLFVATGRNGLNIIKVN